MTVEDYKVSSEKTGIYPVNFDAIDMAKFTPSQVTDSKKYLEMLGNVYQIPSLKCNL